MTFDSDWDALEQSNPKLRQTLSDALTTMRALGWAVTVFTATELKENGLSAEEAEERMVRYVNG
jgi:predicted metal-binding membrane protein